MKHTQREAITKQNQARMTTGEEPEESEIQLDPTVSLIAPHIMSNVPTVFSSDITSKQIIGMYKNQLFVNGKL